MFLRSEEKKVYDNSYTLVPFCKKCNSQNVETIYKCKDCGSSNIQPPYFNILHDTDERAKKKSYKIKTFYIYKCDKCGKEFEGLHENPNKHISCIYGEFVPYKDDEYDEWIYPIEEDLCSECLQKICDKLNKEMEDICEKDHVKDTINNI